MPVTTVQKIITVMSMVTSRMKASPSGFMATARAGLSAPKMTASTIPTVTCTHKEEYQRRMRAGGRVAGMVGVVMFSLVSYPYGSCGDSRLGCQSKAKPNGPLRRLQRLHQPRDDHFFEDPGIGPHAHLPPEMTATRVDPCVLRDIAFAQQQVIVGNRNLRVEYSCNHKHRRHGLPEQVLMHQRHLRQIFPHLIERVHAFEDVHQRRNLIE